MTATSRRSPDGTDGYPSPQIMLPQTDDQVQATVDEIDAVASQPLCGLMMSSWPVAVQVSAESS